MELVLLVVPLTGLVFVVDGSPSIDTELELAADAALRFLDDFVVVCFEFRCVLGLMMPVSSTSPVKLISAG